MYLQAKRLPKTFLYPAFFLHTHLHKPDIICYFGQLTIQSDEFSSPLSPLTFELPDDRSALYYSSGIVNFKYHKNETDYRYRSTGYFRLRNHYLMRSYKGLRMQRNSRICRIRRKIRSNLTLILCNRLPNG